MKLSSGTIAAVVFIGIFVFLIFANGKPQPNSNTEVLSSNTTSQGTLTVPVDSFEFGTISMKDGKVSHVYEIKNESQETVELGEIFTSCMCTSAQAIYPDGTSSKIAGMRGHGAPTYLDKTIQPGDTFKIEVIFDPAAHGPTGTGAIHRSVYIDTNSKQSPKIELTFDAEVVR